MAGITAHCLHFVTSTHLPPTWLAPPGGPQLLLERFGPATVASGGPSRTPSPPAKFEPANQCCGRSFGVVDIYVVQHREREREGEGERDGRTHKYERDGERFEGGLRRCHLSVRWSRIRNDDQDESHKAQPNRRWVQKVTCPVIVCAAIVCRSWSSGAVELPDF